MTVACLRYYGYVPLAEIDKMSIYDFSLLMKAAGIHEIDTMHHIHLQAFQNVRAKARKSAGRGKTRPVYTTYKKFFDYEKELKKARRKKESSRYDGLKKKLKEKKANE